MIDFRDPGKPTIDIVFITNVTIPRDTGDPEVYKPLRLHIGKHEATIQFLKHYTQQETKNGLTENYSAKQNKIYLPQVLTPIYISNYVRKRGLTFIEIPCLEIGNKQLRELLKNKIGLIAISTTWLPGLYGATLIRKAVETLRSYAPNIPIIVGGVLIHKSMKIRSLIKEKKINQSEAEQLAEHYFLLDNNLDKKIDAFVVSEGGENTLMQIAKRIKNGLEYRNIQNLALPSNNDFIFTEIIPENIDLDKEVIDWRYYQEIIQFQEAPIRSGVGCPFNCGFCDFTGLYKTAIRNMDSLVNELQTLTSTGAESKKVYFTDDNLAITKNRISRFAKTLINAKLDIKWRSFCRVDAIDKEVAELMKESGCTECFLGIESGDARILKNMNKKIDVENVLKVIEILNSVGINTLSTFVIGFPGETNSTIERTAQFISSIPSGKNAHAIHQYYLFRFELLPLSPISQKEQRLKYNLKGIGEKWSHSTMDAKEAKAAIREIFLSVNGPAHIYLESIPETWPIHKTISFLEMRDVLQKKYLIDNKPISISPLINMFKKNE